MTYVKRGSFTYTRVRARMRTRARALEATNRTLKPSYPYP
jgi:hypothetical protein